VNKDDPNRSAPIIDMAASMADYQSRIKRLEEVIIYFIHRKSQMEASVRRD
jgi:hypothetical protein